MEKSKVLNGLLIFLNNDGFLKKKKTEYVGKTNSCRKLEKLLVIQNYIITANLCIL
jgi:hypothetical protein